MGKSNKRRKPANHPSSCGPRRHTFQRRWTLAGVLAVAGCDSGENSEDSSGTSGQEACDPFAERTRDIALERVIAAGREASGRIWLADENDRGPRVFAESPQGLQRLKVLGWGQGSDERGEQWMFSVRDDMRDMTLLIEQAPGETPRMGLIEGEVEDDKGQDIDQADPLQVVDDTAWQALNSVDLPGVVHIEYLATVADGRSLLVTRPEHDWSYEDFRLFLGTHATMREHTVTDVLRAKDGGSTQIFFVDDDDTPCIADFPWGGVPSLDEGGERSAMVSAVDKTWPDEATEFICEVTRG